MELVSLHPLDPVVARTYVQALKRETPVPASWKTWWNPDLVNAVDTTRSGNERAANQVTYGLAQALATEQPVFAQDGCAFSIWEARIDRGIGMLMRPPSRLFGEAGMDEAVARVMPIRLDLQHGMMGGSYVPARLIPDLARMLDTHLERTARRMHEGEYDTMALLGLMLEAVTYAREREFGLFEAMDVVGPDGEALPGTVVIRADRKRIDPAIRARIETAIKPPKKPGLFARVFGRASHPVFSATLNSHAQNGHVPLDRNPMDDE